jgi:transposase
LKDAQPNWIHCEHGDGTKGEAAATTIGFLDCAHGVAANRRASILWRVNQLLAERGFDEFVESQCEGFYADSMGRPSLVPRRYFRLLLIGYFEGIEGERGIAWRAADSLALRRFLELELSEQPPDHSTISRTRRLIDVETHQAVFRWVLELLAEKGLLKGKTVGIDATTLEANAAMR